MLSSTAAAIAPAPDVLRDLLAVSLTGVIFYTPLYDPAGTGQIVDFTFEYLNPAAQRMLAMPEVPTVTHNQQWPHSIEHGTFAFHVEAFESGEPREYNVNYQADGYDNYYRLAARRSGQGLLVSFTDAVDQPRSPVEVTLGESQAAEKAARADAQRNELRDFMEQAPVAVVIYRGAEFRVELANATTLAIWDRALPDVLGQPVFDVLPEADTPDIRAIFEQVFTTGVPHTAHEQPTFIYRYGQQETVYWNFVFQPEYLPDGRIRGIRSVGTEVTEQVRARQQVEQLNHELESRVEARTRQLHVQSQRLERLFAQAPAAICILGGPDLVFELVNPIYQQFFPDRPLLGKPLLDALPELTGHTAYYTMRRVFDTGETNRQQALHTPLARRADGPLEDRYFTYVQQPRYNEHGHIDGVLVFGFEVTELVQARQQADTLQAQLLATVQQQASARALVYQVFEQTPACIALLRGPTHRFEYVNNAYQDLFPGRELVGRELAEVLPDAADQGFLTLLDGVYRTGDTFFGNELPLAIAQPDGAPPRQAYFTFTYQAYRENGQVVGISIFAFDVAEQVLARQQREAERQQLHNLFMEAPAPIFILDGPELVFQLVNPAYQRVFPGRTLLGKPLLDALPEMRDIPLLRDLERTYETGETFVAQELPLMMTRREGAPLEVIYWTFTYQARRNAQGDVDGILVFAHEVTDQVQARRVVEARESSFQLLADNVPGTLWVTNPAGECTYLSAHWYAITGQAQTEGLGLGWTNAVHPDDAAAASAAFLAANTRREPYNCLYRLRQRDGEYRWVTDKGLPRFGATGAYEGMVGALVDVHEQKLAELALQRLSAELGATNEQLTRTNVDLDNFIYTASHDLRVPIVNIEGLLQAFARVLPPTARVGSVPEMLQLMQHSVDRFKRTIAHLTDVSKLQQEHGQPATTQARLTADVPATARLPFSEKNLRSVVYNLLSNALKYRHPDRTPDVQLTYHQQDQHHVLRVQDNGLGFDVAKSEAKLFGMFQRLHNHVEGSGIGLYMVKKIVENSGGRIDVASQPGEGTTFTVFFPVHPAS